MIIGAIRHGRRMVVLPVLSEPVSAGIPCFSENSGIFRFAPAVAATIGENIRDIRTLECLPIATSLPRLRAPEGENRELPRQIIAPWRDSIAAKRDGIVVYRERRVTMRDEIAAIPDWIAVRRKRMAIMRDGFAPWRHAIVASGSFATDLGGG
jgi:hypothetical protein